MFPSALINALQKDDVILICDAGGGTTVRNLSDTKQFLLIPSSNKIGRMSMS